MSCGEQLFVAQVFLYGGVIGVVYGDWLTRYSRLTYWRQGGWYRDYSFAIPGWSGAAAGGASTVMAIGLGWNLLSRCGSQWTGTPLAVAATIVAILTGLTGIVRLVRGKRVAKSRDQYTVAAAVYEQMAGAETSQKWRVPRLLKITFIEYGATSIVAIALTFAAFVVPA